MEQIKCYCGHTTYCDCGPLPKQTLEEAAEITIYPFFEEAGGAQSERVYIKQFVQKFVKTGEENLFNTEDTAAVNNPF